MVLHLGEPAHMAEHGRVRTNAELFPHAGSDRIVEGVPRQIDAVAQNEAPLPLGNLRPEPIDARLLRASEKPIGYVSRRVAQHLESKAGQPLHVVLSMAVSDGDTPSTLGLGQVKRSRAPDMPMDDEPFRVRLEQLAEHAPIRKAIHPVETRCAKYPAPE